MIVAAIQTSPPFRLTPGLSPSVTLALWRSSLSIKSSEIHAQASLQMSIDELKSWRKTGLQRRRSSASILTRMKCTLSNLQASTTAQFLSQSRTLRRSLYRKRLRSVGLRGKNSFLRATRRASLSLEKPNSLSQIKKTPQRISVNRRISMAVKTRMQRASSQPRSKTS